MAVQISGNDITVPRDGSFTRNVTIGGTLTYEDVTNIDSVGLVTARTGIEIGARPGVAASISVDGNMIVSGITTFTPGGSEIVRINSGGLLVYNDVSFFGDSTNAYWDKSANQFLLNDNTKLSVGSGSDLSIYHDGTNTTFDNDTGQFNLDGASGSAIRFLNNGTYQCQVGSAGLDFPDTKKIRLGDSEDLELQHDGTNNIIKTSTAAEIQINNGSEYMARFIPNGAVNLYHDNTKMFETASYGVAFASNVRVNSDNNSLQIGAGQDMKLYHTSNNSYLTNDTGYLYIQSDSISLAAKSAGENFLVANKDGAVGLYYDSVEKLATFSQGVDIHVSGNSGLRVRGNVADVDPRIVFRRKNNDGNNSEPAAIRMTYQGGSTHESGHLDFLTNGDSGSAALSVKVRFQNDGVKYFDSTFDTTANNARKSYFSGTGQLLIGRNAHEHYIVFQDVSNNQIGGIVRGAGSSVAYNTTSDYRLKENVVDLTDAITRLKTLSPKRFNFISDPSITLDGFIAHEVTAVPEAVEGEKDAVVTQAMIDSQEVELKSVGDPIYQGIDQSKLVPLLTAALQEAVAKIETLETKVAALEG